MAGQVGRVEMSVRSLVLPFRITDLRALQDGAQRADGQRGAAMFRHDHLESLDRISPLAVAALLGDQIKAMPFEDRFDFASSHSSHTIAHSEGYLTRNSISGDLERICL